MWWMAAYVLPLPIMESHTVIIIMNREFLSGTSMVPKLVKKWQ